MNFESIEYSSGIGLHTNTPPSSPFSHFCLQISATTSGSLALKSTLQSLSLVKKAGNVSTP